VTERTTRGPPSIRPPLYKHPEKAKRTTEAMLAMTKLDIAVLGKA
jgi:hypothetical protein